MRERRAEWRQGPHGAHLFFLSNERSVMSSSMAAAHGASKRVQWMHACARDVMERIAYLMAPAPDVDESSAEAPDAAHRVTAHFHSVVERLRDLEESPASRSVRDVKRVLRLAACGLENEAAFGPHEVSVRLHLLEQSHALTHATSAVSWASHRVARALRTGADRARARVQLYRHTR